jgi:predicted MFS family arabinose efflux permease
MKHILLPIGGALANATVMGISRFTHTPILPLMAAEWHFSAQTAGWLATCNYIGYLIGALAAASKRIHSREPFLLWVSLCASPLLLFAMAVLPENALFAAFIVRFLSGLTSAFVFIFAAARVIHVLHQFNLGNLTGVHFAGVGFGITLTGMLAYIAYHIQGDAISSSQLWFWSGVLATMTTCGSVILLRKAPATHAAPAQNTTPHSSNNANSTTPRWLTIGYTLEGFGYIVALTFIVSAVQNMTGSVTSSYWTWIMLGLAALFGSYLMLRAMRHYDAENLLILAMLLQVLGLIAPLIFPTHISFVCAGIIMGGTFVGIVGLAMACARDIAPEHATQLMAKLTAMYGIAQIISPPISGALADVTGSYTYALALAAASIFCGTLCFWRHRKLQKNIVVLEMQ